MRRRLQILECVQKESLIREVEALYEDDCSHIVDIQYAVSIRNNVPFYTAFVTYDKHPFWGD